MMKLLIALTMTIVLTGCNRTPDTVDGIIAAAKPIELNAVEQDFVKTREISLGYPARIQPTIFEKNGLPAGYAAKVAELISKRTGLRIKYVMFETNAKMREARATKLIDGKNLIDGTIVAASPNLPDRVGIIIVTDRYVSSNGVMLVDELPIKFPMKVAIGSKYAVQESIAKIGGLVTFVEFPNEELGFQALTRKEVGAAIMSQVTADFLEKKYQQPYAHSGMNFVFGVGFGCQIEEATMCQILNKGVNSFTPEERKVFEKEFFVKPIAPPGPPVKYGPP